MSRSAAPQPPGAPGSAGFTGHRFLARAGLGPEQPHLAQLILYGRVNDLYWFGRTGLDWSSERHWMLEFIDMRATLLAALDALGYGLVVFYGRDRRLTFGTTGMRRLWDEALNAPTPDQAANTADDDYAQMQPRAAVTRTIEGQQTSVSDQLTNLLTLVRGDHRRPDLRSAVVLERAQNLIPSPGDPEHTAIIDLLQQLGSPGAPGLSILVCDLADVRTLPDSLVGGHRSGVRAVSVGLPNRLEIDQQLRLMEQDSPDLQIQDPQALIQRLGDLDIVGIRELAERARSFSLPLSPRTIWQLGGHDDGGWADLLDKPKTLSAIERALKRLKGQDGVIRHVIDTLRGVRERLRMQREAARFDERPLAIFFFAGPTGVGKTEVFRILSEALAGIRALKVNMGEYTQEHQMMRFVGSPPSYRGHPKGELGQFLLDNPSSIILFDEFEKAHPRIWDSFLSMLEGGMTTGDGERINMSQTMLFFTSNAAADDLKPIDGTNEQEREKLRETNKKAIIDALKHTEGGRPELIGRLQHAMYAFDHLGPEVVRDILNHKLEQVRARLEHWLGRHGGATLRFSDAVEHHYVQRWASDPEAGGGARAVVNEIEFLLHDRVLSDLSAELDRDPDYQGQWTLWHDADGLRVDRS